ncbi:hypothetical protein GCM10011591_09070 [Nocardia camponoti]|uniref:Uncharacterized protein n=1 Tax=Nocardia camponoti TaxID=1616106 RepID=A0A917QBX1_9NOCA|nr:hypothetical protein GCM10011591_09070 [Nocardia camponoti]
MTALGSGSPEATPWAKTLLSVAFARADVTATLAIAATAAVLPLRRVRRAKLVSAGKAGTAEFSTTIDDHNAPRPRAQAEREIIGQTSTFSFTDRVGTHA